MTDDTEMFMAQTKDLFVVKEFRKGHVATVGTETGAPTAVYWPLLQLKSTDDVEITCVFDPDQLPFLKEMVIALMEGGD